MFIVLSLLFSATSATVTIPEGDDEEETFPDINALFAATNNYPDYLADSFFEGSIPAGARKHNIEEVEPGIALPPNVKIDIDKLDVKRFKAKLQQFQQSLIPQNDTRKWWPWGSAKILNPIIEVDNHKMKVKLMDMMLQLIYQAKARLDSIDSQPGFSTKDASFRAAFLFTRLRDLRRALLQIFNTQVSHQYNKDWYKPWGYVNYFLFLHQKAAQKYSDFIYLYKIALALIQWKDERDGVGNTLPAYVRQYLEEVRLRRSRDIRDKTKTTYVD